MSARAANTWTSRNAECEVSLAIGGGPEKQYVSWVIKSNGELLRIVLIGSLTMSLSNSGRCLKGRWRDDNIQTSRDPQEDSRPMDEGACNKAD